MSEKTKASPAEEEGNQTVTAEPSAEEQRGIREESIADSEVADAATMTDSIKSRASKAAGSFANTTRRLGRGGQKGEWQDRQGPVEPSKILYVGNLYFDLAPEQLKTAFEPFGTVTNHKIVTDSSGMSKG